MKTSIIISLLFVAHLAVAQSQSGNEKGHFSVETELQTYLSKGYSIGGTYWLPDSHWTVGLLVAGSEASGRTKEIVFTGGENLDRVRNTWLVAGRLRYFFNEKQKGFYAMLNAGYEEFMVEKNSKQAHQNNVFVTPFVGYTWFFKGNTGLFLQPAIGSIFIVGRGEEKTVEGVKYRLNPVLPNPTISLGYKF
jgi:hypothetical protein